MTCKWVHMPESATWIKFFDRLYLSCLVHGETWTMDRTGIHTFSIHTCMHAPTRCLQSQQCLSTFFIPIRMHNHAHAHSLDCHSVLLRVACTRCWSMSLSVTHPFNTSSLIPEYLPAQPSPAQLPSILTPSPFPHPHPHHRHSSPSPVKN